MLQLASSFAEIWDDMLPPTPAAIWDSNLAEVKAALVGGSPYSPLYGRVVGAVDPDPREGMTSARPDRGSSLRWGA
jgi:hypothetical protein